jgi:hypothetical protein
MPRPGDAGHFNRKEARITPLMYHVPVLRYGFSDQGHGKF